MSGGVGISINWVSCTFVVTLKSASLTQASLVRVGDGKIMMKFELNGKSFCTFQKSLQKSFLQF